MGVHHPIVVAVVFALVWSAVLSTFTLRSSGTLSTDHFYAAGKYIHWIRQISVSRFDSARTWRS